VLVFSDSEDDILPDLIPAIITRDHTRSIAAAIREPDNRFMEERTFRGFSPEPEIKTRWNPYPGRIIKIFAHRLAIKMDENLLWYHSTHEEVWDIILNAPFSGDLVFEEALSRRVLIAAAALQSEWKKKVENIHRDVLRDYRGHLRAVRRYYSPRNMRGRNRERRSYRHPARKRYYNPFDSDYIQYWAYLPSLGLQLASHGVR